MSGIEERNWEDCLVDEELFQLLEEKFYADEKETPIKSAKKSKTREPGRVRTKKFHRKWEKRRRKGSQNLDPRILWAVYKSKVVSGVGKDGEARIVRAKNSVPSSRKDKKRYSNAKVRHVAGLEGRQRSYYKRVVRSGFHIVRDL